MILPSDWLPDRFCDDRGVLVRSPFIAGLPVHSIHVMLLSVVLTPLLVFHVGCVGLEVVPATMQTKTRSLPTLGAVARINCPTVVEVLATHAPTAKWPVEVPLP